ncbi:hypothetical protein QEH52_20180, partial [Coraliomargarita sp. SDUM461003]
ISKRMKFFPKVVSGVRIDGRSVYKTTTRKAFMSKGTFLFPENYLEDLQSAVKESVPPEAWQLIRRENKTKDPDYIEYTETVRKQLIGELGLQDSEEEVKIGLYHGDMFVISFPTDERIIDLPYYYMGIQLKPFNRK